MSSDPRNVIDGLVDAAWKLFGVALLVWLAVELLSQVWMWIVGAALIIGVVVVAWRVYQARLW
ncbi:MAG: hypothetical protein QM705_15220 [Ancrocorticia sp.]